MATLTDRSRFRAFAAALLRAADPRQLLAARDGRAVHVCVRRLLAVLGAQHFLSGGRLHHQSARAVFLGAAVRHLPHSASDSDGVSVRLPVRGVAGDGPRDGRQRDHRDAHRRHFRSCASRWRRWPSASVDVPDRVRDERVDRAAVGRTLDAHVLSDHLSHRRAAGRAAVLPQRPGHGQHLLRHARSRPTTRR